MDAAVDVFLAAHSLDDGRCQRAVIVFYVRHKGNLLFSVRGTEGEGEMTAPQPG